MSKFNPKDRVAVYIGGESERGEPERLTGTIEAVDGEGCPGVRFANGDLWYCHPKQCRRLKPARKKRRLWAIYDKHGGWLDTRSSREGAEETAYCQRSEDLYIVEFVEVVLRPKKASSE